MSLVIMVGLSLLGLGFVAISESENAIAVNERHAAQTQAVAETGARAVVEYFQDPRWAFMENFLPANSDALIGAGGYKRRRTVGSYSGVYRAGNTSLLLLDRPFRPAEVNRFYGDDATADLEFNRDNAGTQLTNINTALFGADSRVSGRIEEIKIYAPPIIGGTLTGGFWVGGDRYGYATVKVTAERWSREEGGSLVSRRVVRLVVGEFPMPVPGGPVQSQATIAFGGTADVHWGDVTSFGDLAAGGASLPNSTFPWANPYDRPQFENEYDPVVFPGGTANYLSEVLGKSYEDPWFGTRARGNNSNCDPNCGTYSAGVEETNITYSSFEDQTANIFPTSKLVTFPDIRYDIWKKIATASRGMKGIYYFTYDPGTSTTCGIAPCFRKNGQGADRTFGYWVNTLADARLGAGLYFFDTTNGLPPSGTTNLTPAVDINSAAIADPFRMEGFIYLNATTYGSSGVGSSAPSAGFNMPAEIFRDIGYRPVDAGGAFLMNGSEPVWNGVSNGLWDFQDLNGNGRFDLVLTATDDTPTSNPAYTGTTQPTRRVVPWNTPTCTASTCSEPHEPYINFVYPEMGSPTGSVVARWQAPGSQTRRPKKRGITQAYCDNAPNTIEGDDNCTSNKYDGPRVNNPNDSGAIVNLTVLLDGILFNEGGFSQTGNADYYGALLVRGAASGTGTPVIWFNERLLKGEPPPNFPRVMIYSVESDPVQ